MKLREDHMIQQKNTSIDPVQKGEMSFFGEGERALQGTISEVLWVTGCEKQVVRKRGEGDVK